MWSIRRVSRLLVVVTLVAAVVAACSSNGNDSAPSNSGSSKSGSTSNGAPSTVKFGDVASEYNTSYIVQLVAQGQNLFAPIEQKFHTKFEFSVIQSGADVIPTMIGGGADIVMAGVNNFVQGIAKGVPLQIIMEVGRGGGIILTGAKKYESSYGTDLAKYKSGVWGYTAAGSNGQVIMQAEAEAAGLNWTSIKQVATGPVTAAVSGLQTGRVDIAALDAGSAGTAIAKNIGYVAYNSDLDTGLNGQTVGVAPAITKTFADKYPALTQAIVNVFVKVLKMIQPLLSTPAKICTLLTPDAQKALSGCAESVALIARGLQIDGSISDEAAKDTLDFLVQAKYITSADAQKVMSAQGFTNKYVKAAS